MIPAALTFARDHARILAIVGIIMVVLLLAEWRRFRRDHRAMQRAMREPFDLTDLFLAEEVRRALHPDTYAGPTHDHPSRDSDRQRGEAHSHSSGATL